LLFARFRDDMALLSEQVSADGGRGYLFGQAGTHVHVGKKAESIMAPDARRLFPLKSASVMDVSIVTGLEL
jgi:hypothetical protein